MNGDKEGERGAALRGLVARLSANYVRSPKTPQPATGEKRAEIAETEEKKKVYFKPITRGSDREMSAAEEKRFKELTSRMTREGDREHATGRGECCGPTGSGAGRVPCRNLRNCPQRPHTPDYSRGRGGRTHGR